jgi:TonB family protein
MPEDRFVMFRESIPGEKWQPRPAWLISIGIHAVMVAVLLHGRTPVFVAPSSVLGGANGAVVTHLYWASGTDTAEKASGKETQLRERSEARLTWKKSDKGEFNSPRDLHPTPEKQDKVEIASAATNPAPSAGTAYGSLSEGASLGHEIRAALPAVTFEPVVDPDDLPGAEGNVVVEITIDEAGNIVNKVVVQSLGSAIDAKVMAALEYWRFRPATRDGVPIPSKQDVVYHFKPR